VSNWIIGAPLAERGVELVTRGGQSLGTASFASKRARGNVAVGGTSGNFSAELAKGKAGIYRAISGKAGEVGFSETGWIVLSDGRVCGATNSITSSGFKSVPVRSRPKGKVTDFTNPFPF
jgi:hypothetical protein